MNESKPNLELEPEPFFRGTLQVTSFTTRLIDTSHYWQKESH